MSGWLATFGLRSVDGGADNGSNQKRDSGNTTEPKTTAEVLVQRINQLREETARKKNIQLKPLEMSSTLTASAQRQADTHIFKHSGDGTTENLAMLPHKADQTQEVDKIMRMWTVEDQQWNFAHWKGLLARASKVGIGIATDPRTHMDMVVFKATV